MLILMIFPSDYFRANYSQEYKNLLKNSAGFNETLKKNRENSHADTLHRYLPYTNLSHLSKRLTRTKALCYAFRGSQMSFLLMIYLPSHHSVAVWHSNCKRVFISLGPEDS